MGKLRVVFSFALDIKTAEKLEELRGDKPVSKFVRENIVEPFVKSKKV